MGKGREGGCSCGPKAKLSSQAGEAVGSRLSDGRCTEYLRRGERERSTLGWGVNYALMRVPSSCRCRLNGVIS